MAARLDPTYKPSDATTNPWLAWWPVGVGLLALYIPTFWHLGSTIWRSEEQAHGPIVLGIVLWLLWQKRDAFRMSAISRTRIGSGNGHPAPLGGEAGTQRPASAQSARTSIIAGWPVLTFGLLLYVLGRSQDILIFDVGSMIPVIAGVALISGGWRSLRALWFPLLFIVFMIPLPGILVDALTGPLKQTVSWIAETLLYAVGYPIARSGVVLTIGQYELLVADACSGLHSIFSLSALGFLYLYLMRYRSYVLNGILAASILPIAFAANVVRVVILVLITYHFGDEAGQGFIHGFAGILLFIVALLFLFALDAAIRFGCGRLFKLRME